MSTAAAVAAIEFALHTDDGLSFLRCWNTGDFDAIRKEWPDAPATVFIGADPSLTCDTDLVDLNTLLRDRFSQGNGVLLIPAGALQKNAQHAALFALNNALSLAGGAPVTLLEMPPVTDDLPYGVGNE